MTVKTIATLKSDVATNINDNTIGAITPADVRSSVIDTIDSVLNVSLQKENNLSDLINVATARTNLGLVIGTNVQAYSSVLQNTTASFTTTLNTAITTNTSDIENLNLSVTNINSDISDIESDIVTINSDISTINTALSNKANATHTHAISDVTNLQTSLNAITAKTDYITISANANIETMQSDISASKAKTDNLTVPSAVNTDTLKSDILSAKTKTDFITVSENVNLNTLKSYNRTTIQSITATGSINSDTVLALVNSSSDVTVTLPLANTLPAMTFINIKRLGTGNVIVALSGSDTIDGSTSSYNFAVDNAVRYSNRRLTTDGISSWYII